jgi:organic hydroperoxide reductase OsmC/OhrA
MAQLKAKTKQFIYKNSLRWKGEKRGLLSSLGKSDIEIATPPEFKGHPGVWTPEDFFVASVNSCIMTTFLYYAQKNGIELVSYESQTEGVLEWIEGRLIFSEIKVKPLIFVKRDSDIQKAKEMIELSKKGCLISNSIKCKVKVLPEIKIEP